MKKTWVIIKENKTGTIKAWRDYDGDIWGAAIYEVLGYHTGSYREALQKYKGE